MCASFLPFPSQARWNLFEAKGTVVVCHGRKNHRQIRAMESAQANGNARLMLHTVLATRSISVRLRSQHRKIGVGVVPPLQSTEVRSHPPLHTLPLNQASVVPLILCLYYFCAIYGIMFFFLLSS